jgi:hypothetical protein
VPFTADILLRGKEERALHAMCDARIERDSLCSQSPTIRRNYCGRLSSHSLTLTFTDESSVTIRIP